MYRIGNWDEEYEVNDKGFDWKPGQQKRAGPLAFIRSQVRGKNISPGWRRLRRASGNDESTTLRNFGLFQKFLELAGDAKREDRNQLPEAGELAFLLDLSEALVHDGLTSLCDAGWIEQCDAVLQESPEIPGIPANQPTNQRNDNQPTTTNHSGKISRWQSVRRSIEIEFEADRGHTKLLTWLGNRMVSEPREIMDRICAKLESLVAESRDKDNPAAWFQTHAGIAVGYNRSKPR